MRILIILHPSGMAQACQYAEMEWITCISHGALIFMPKAFCAYARVRVWGDSVGVIIIEIGIYYSNKHQDKHPNKHNNEVIPGSNSVIIQYE